MRFIRVDEPEGNAHAIMATVSDMLRQIHGRAESRPIIENYMSEAMSGDYENLKEVSKKYCPGLIEFVMSDDVEIEYKLKDKSDDDEDDDVDEYFNDEDDFEDNPVRLRGTPRV